MILSLPSCSIWSGIKTKPFAQDFIGVLSEQRRRLDLRRAATEAHRPARHFERAGDRMLHRLHDSAPLEIRLVGQLHRVEDGAGRHAGIASTRIASRLSCWRVQAAIISSTSGS